MGEFLGWKSGPCFLEGGAELNSRLDSAMTEWEISHMPTQLVKADEKGRVSIKGTKKGQQYLVTAQKGGWWVMAAPKVKTPVRELEGIVADTWEKLGPAPEINYDQI